jgi:DNA repair exonuclease SbcCD ATPase subunit
MSSYAKSKKCSTCARRGQTCERSFHSDKEWEDLQREEKKLAQDLEEAQKQFLQHSQKMNEAMAKVLRLQKHQQFLKERGGRMLDHDQAVADRLNEDDPPTAAEFAEFDRLATQQEVRQLAATSEDASLNRFVTSLDQLPPSFWDAQGDALFGNSILSAGETVEPAGGSPSGSR